MQLAWATAKPGGSITLPTRAWSNASSVAIGGQSSSLAALALANKIEAYCFPQGVVSHFFCDIAAGKPGTMTSVGLDTFIDPRLEGGRLNEVTTQPLIELIQLHGQPYLFFPAFPINVALLRGTTADEGGNITMKVELKNLPVHRLAR